MKTNDVYLHHILEAIEQIEEYVGKIDRSDFMGDSMRQDAVVRQLEIVGEASRQLSESFREEHDAIPWHAIIGMRNRIATTTSTSIWRSSGMLSVTTCRT